MAGLTELTAHRKKTYPAHYVQSILAIGILLVYAIIQLYCIFNPGSDDDLISARLQDVLIIIVSHYFFRRTKAK